MKYTATSSKVTSSWNDTFSRAISGSGMRLVEPRANLGWGWRTLPNIGEVEMVVRVEEDRGEAETKWIPWFCGGVPRSWRGKHGMGCCCTRHSGKVGRERRIKHGSPGPWPLGVQLPASHPPDCPCQEMWGLLRKEGLRTTRGSMRESICTQASLPVTETPGSWDNLVPPTPTSLSSLPLLLQKVHTASVGLVAWAELTTALLTLALWSVPGGTSYLVRASSIILHVSTQSLGLLTQRKTSFTPTLKEVIMPMILLLFSWSPDQIYKL